MMSSARVLMCGMLFLMPFATSVYVVLPHQNLQAGPAQVWIGDRFFLWEAPATPARTGGYLVLLLLHGRFQQAQTWFPTSNSSPSQADFTTKALRDGFFIVAPDARTNKTTRSLRDWGYTEKTLNDSVDLLFIQDILSWLETTPPVAVNMSRLCCLGFGSGGTMASRIGHWFTSRVKALGVCSGANADAVTLHGLFKYPVYNVTGPQSFEPGFPPTLVVVGDLDQRVPPAAGVHFSAELLRAGINSTLLQTASGLHHWQTVYDNATLNWFLSEYRMPSQPRQPVTGPGGSNYSFGAVRKTQYGKGAHEFWIFEPTDPTPQSAPLIVFNHGWAAFLPIYYEAWVDHLVRQGNIVVYPRYQAGLVVGLRYATQYAIDAVKQAITLLQNGSHVRPELDKFAIVGHSLGGGITAEMAALANASGLPVPRAIMPVQPFLRPLTMLSNFSGIPSSTMMLVVIGENDTVAGSASAKLIFKTSTQVPLSQKNFVTQRSDFHGSPRLLADHGAPTCIPNSSWTDAMDYFSTWKLFDALTEYAFYGINREYCLGNTTQQRFMGLWSDGVPVNEMLVTDNP
ncbi:MAG TPA: prolyl oligopeptidase family serine peptidase [Candidatus Thermoplasmatota archaeon]|nr:prolyl oligopeptidase family serine peptidase [Candidatus Thermoplasmatota archaeon]